MKIQFRLGVLLFAAVLLTASLVSPALGGPSLKALVAPLVKRDVAKQLAGKELTGAPGAAGAPGATGPPGAPGGEATPIGGTIPAGTTLRGVFSALMQQASPNGVSAVGYGISFDGYQLSSRPLVEVVGESEEPTTNCPGTPESPTAKAGYVCLYMAENPSDPNGNVQIIDPSRGLSAASGINWKPSTDTATAFGDGRVSQYGFSLSVSGGVSNGESMWGTWAVTG